jgi:uncharacterized membrane protein YphA (DoxX/SURF4 family)
MLSHHDKAELDRIERELAASSPELAQLLRSGKVPGRGWMITLMAVTGVVGALILVLGLITANPALILFGVLSAGTLTTIFIVRRVHQDG